MGLDTVELVMSVEDEFGIVVQLDDYGDLRTVGDLCAYIARQQKIETVCLHPAAFVRIRQALMSEFGLPRRQIRTGTDLEQLFPVRQRRRLWAAFESALGLRIPTLWPSHNQETCVLGGMMIGTVASALLAFVHPLFLLGVVLAPVAGISAMALIDTRFALSFAMPETTVGGLTRSVASLNAMTLSDEIRRTADHNPEIWSRLRTIVSQSLSIPEDEILPHSRFIEDLLK